MAKVDILLPYWGEVSLLKNAVESVISQTEQDWRLVVFDDCYPSDEPAEYFSSLDDSRILYNRNRKNLGITNNFNLALQSAESEYCIMMGCDDIMLPTYLETALENIQGADFYQPYVDVIDESGAVYSPLGDRIKRFLQPKRSGLYFGQRLARSLCIGNWLYFPSILWKTQVIKKYGFDPRYKIAEDVILEFNIIRDGGTLFFDKGHTTFQYRRFAHSLSSKEKVKGGVRFNEEAEVYDHYAHEFAQIG